MITPSGKLTIVNVYKRKVTDHGLVPEVPKTGVFNPPDFWPKIFYNVHDPANQNICPFEFSRGCRFGQGIFCTWNTCSNYFEVARGVPEIIPLTNI